MKWNSRIRCALVCLAFTGLFSAFSFRLVYLQMVKHDEYSALAANTHVDKVPIYAERGAIVDANGDVLAHDTPGELVYVDGKHVNDAERLAPLLAATLNLPPDEVAEKLATRRPYIVMQHQVPPAVTTLLKQQTKEQDLRGVYYIREPGRVYPNNSMLCHVIGFTDFKHVGIQGVEASMEGYLHGQEGFRFIERNRKGEEIVSYRGQERAPRDGARVQLTIDLNLQTIVENEIDEAMRKYSPIKATIILMRPETGEVLAMANRPHFDLNQRNEAKPEEMKNRAIIDVMEPGSTFKIVTAATALNERKVQLDSTIFCENGVWSYGGKLLHDHGHGYGELSVQDILVHSSNIGAAKLALSVGEQKFYEYIRRFGFGEVTGVELPGETPGLLAPPQRWNKLSITRIPMGHEIGVSPLQMTVAMAAIANGGKLVTPRIVKSITKPDGEVIRSQPTMLRQVISPETALQVGNALRGVVSDRGTAAAAAVPGFTIAGKTGTAQKLIKGQYDPNKTVVSFLGFLPAERPEFVGLVVLDDPHTATREENYGGKVAGPIFASIAEKAARYLDLEPHEEIQRALPVGQVALTNPTRR
jgi:cell division protein FtsI (penicillin-binding protein 3)/stage V sporulation protein D (sporulation-specific penicillin-binding protein)